VYSTRGVSVFHCGSNRCFNDNRSGAHNQEALAGVSMTYTQIAIFAVLFAISFDLYLFNTQLLKRKVFWTSYAIIVGFQLLTNWWLTSRNIVMYSPDAIIGWRIASAPVEDLLFGFALVLGVLTNWIRLGASDKR
jgi:lycopene cyclase domain-containing protein